MGGALGSRLGRSLWRGVVTVGSDATTGSDAGIIVVKVLPPLSDVVSCAMASCEHLSSNLWFGRYA